MPKLVLIDGYSQAFRAFYGLPPDFVTSSGELTNAVYGFASMLLNVIAEEKPEYIAVAFDVGRTFRHDQYAEYKSTRAKMPDEMRVQLPRIRELIEALNIPIFEIEGYEADDLIGSLVQQAQAQDVDSVLVSGDRDLFQLITPRVRVRYTAGGPRPKTVLYDAEAVAARFGVQPEQLPDFKALTGDTSDNIPGVPGVGDKTAATLINTYGSIDTILLHSQALKPPRLQTVIAEHSAQIRLNKQLATIVTDLPIALDLERCRTRDYDRARVLALFRELEFKSLVERLPAVEAGPATAVEPATSASLRYRLAATEADLTAVIHQCQAAPLIAVDVEATSTDPMQARLVGIALAWDKGEAAYVPVQLAPDGTTPTGLSGLPLFAEMPAAQPPPAQPGLPLAVVQRVLGPLLASELPPKAAHNASYDLTVLHEAGLPVGGVEFDTFLGEWLCNPGSHSLGLKAVAFARLGVHMTEITELIGKGKAQITMDQVPVAQVTDYAAADVDMTLQIQPLIEAELAQKNQTRLFREVEMPLVPVLVTMERAGVLLDLPFLKEMEKTLEARLATLEADIHGLAGYAFNINSTQQLADVLFGKLAIPSQGLPRTGTGKISLAAGVLEGMIGRHPIIDLILEHRQLGKLQSTYVVALPNLVNRRTGRVHTSFNQAGAETGRISSSNPNLQNIPIRTEIGRQVRRAFIAPPGWKLVSADYSQVELRIVAHASRDPNLVGAFERGEDVHASTAAAVYGVPLEQVTKAQRARAKTVNFGLVYGQGAFGLAQQTGMTQAEAGEFITRYFAIYPQVKSYLDGLRSQAAEQGFVETLLGRRRYFPELAAGTQTPYNVRQALERAAINAPIQGSSADIIKIAMIRLAARLQAEGLRSRMIMQVHDELVLEAPDSEVATVVPLVRDVMSGAYTLSIPLLVEVEVGQNWLDMETV